MTVIEQHRHEKGDGRNHPQQKIVEPDDVIHYRGRAFLQAELPRFRLARRG
jgi:hypothetical protein